MTTKDAVLNPNATLIDLRNADELEAYGSLPQAKHIPLNCIPDHLEEIKACEKPLVLFCKSGGRAARAVEFLTDQGVTDLYNGGGLTDVQAIFAEQD